MHIHNWLSNKKNKKKSILIDKQIRSDWNEDEQEWYFAVVDVFAVLTDSSDPKDYWYRMKKREQVSGFELSTICRQLKLVSIDGKNMLLIVLPSKDC